MTEPTADDPIRTANTPFEIAARRIVDRWDDIEAEAGVTAQIYQDPEPGIAEAVGQVQAIIEQAFREAESCRRK